jgi:hypothetical protein
LVPDGTFSHERPGVRDDPAQANSCGSVAPGVTESTVRVKFSDGVNMGVGMDVVTGEEFASGEGASGTVQPQMMTNTTIRHGEKIRRISMDRISPAGKIYLTKPAEVSGP